MPFILRPFRRFPVHCAVAVRRTIYLVLIFGLAATMVGCSWRTRFLSDSINRATADDVASNLGAPALTHRLDSGEEVWTYRYNSVNGCVEYIVKFDSGKILRDWDRHGC